MRVYLSIYVSAELSRFAKDCERLGIDITLGTFQSSDIICLAMIEEEDLNLLRLAVPELNIEPLKSKFGMDHFVIGPQRRNNPR